MADNVDITPGTGAKIAADETPYSGDTTQVQIIRQVHVSGTEGSKTLQEINGNSTPAASAYGTTVRKVVVLTLHRITSGSDAVSVKASAGTLKSVHVFNNKGVPIYVKFHNTAGTPTPGSGVVLTVGVQAGLSRDFVFPEGGRAFSVGIGMSVVSDIADSGSTAVSANDASVEVCYE